MWRRATGTPIDAATFAREAAVDSDTKFLGVPRQPELVGRRHVPDERRRRDDRGTCQEAFAADAHPVLPVAVERRDGALSFLQCVWTLAEARTAPRLANLAANRAKDTGDRLTVEPPIGALDLSCDAASPWKDHERRRSSVGAALARSTDDERRRQ